MHTLGLRNLAHLTVVALDGIGRIDYLTDSRGVLKIAAQHLPFVPPRLDDNGVKFAPLILQMVEFCLCFFLCVSGIDQLQIFEEFLLILTSDILHSKPSAPKRTHGEDCILATAFFFQRSIVLYAWFCCQTRWRGADNGDSRRSKSDIAHCGANGALCRVRRRCRGQDRPRHRYRISHNGLKRHGKACR